MTQLNRLIGTKSSAQDGVLMFNDDGPLISQDGAWVPLQLAVLRSPNGDGWRLVVDNSGNLSAEAV